MVTTTNTATPDFKTLMGGATATPVSKPAAEAKAPAASEVGSADDALALLETAIAGGNPSDIASAVAYLSSFPVLPSNAAPALLQAGVLMTNQQQAAPTNFVVNTAETIKAAEAAEAQPGAKEPQAIKEAMETGVVTTDHHKHHQHGGHHKGEHKHIEATVALDAKPNHGLGHHTSRVVASQGAVITR